MLRSSEQHEAIRTFTNLVVLSASFGILAITALIWWVSLGQWPDNLRLISAGSVSLGGVVFVLMRWRYRILPRVEPGRSLFIPVTYVLGLGLGFIVFVVFAVWIVLPPR
jgi:hypothetical protein